MTTMITAYDGLNVPDRAKAPATFNTDVGAFLTAVKTAAAQGNAQASELNATANAITAMYSVFGNDGPLILAAANYKGPWSGLTGPLAFPASVSHGGRLWMLLDNLANVALDEPGVTAGSKWVDRRPTDRKVGEYVISAQQPLDPSLKEAGLVYSQAAFPNAFSLFGALADRESHYGDGPAGAVGGNAMPETGFRSATDGVNTIYRSSTSLCRLANNAPAAVTAVAWSSLSPFLGNRPVAFAAKSGVFLALYSASNVWYVARSTDAGATWSATALPAMVGGYFSIFATENKFYVISAGSGSTIVISSSVDGVVWGGPLTISNNATTGFNGDIVFEKNGNSISVVYFAGTSAYAPYSCRIYSADDGVTWSRTSLAPLAIAGVLGGAAMMNGVVLIPTPSGMCWTSSDYGVTWTRFAIPLVDTVYGIVARGGYFWMRGKVGSAHAIWRIDPTLNVAKPMGISANAAYLIDCVSKIVVGGSEGVYFDLYSYNPATQFYVPKPEGLPAKTKAWVKLS